jgi:Undecaprenyl-phosphate glucose phosphotransferase
MAFGQGVVRSYRNLPPIAHRASPGASISHHAIGPLVAGIDFVGLFALGVLSGIGYEQLVRGIEQVRPIYFGLGCFAATLTVALLHSRGFYQRSFVLAQNTVAPILKVWLTVFALLAIAGFLTGMGARFSRGALVTYFVAGGIFLIAVQWLARRLLTHAVESGALKGRRVVLIGDRSEGSPGDLGLALKRHGYSLASCFMFGGSGQPADGRADLPWQEISDLCQAGKVDEVMLAVPWSDVERIEETMHELRRLPIPVRLLPDRAAWSLMRQPMADIGLTRTIELQREPLSWRERIFKRAFDIVTAGSALIFLSPLMLAAALLIRLDSPGPVFFRQTRVGFNGQPFRIWKFRSMRTLDDGHEIRQATRNDARVTAVGQWLRATSVDELPQLINVLVGDMSLIGPRPHAVAHDNQYDARIADYALRRHVRPGITGWAQVCGFRGETPTVDLMLRRVEHDLWYIHNWSLWLDCVIVMRTAVALMRPQNAY